jgi:hypothetical protein
MVNLAAAQIYRITAALGESLGESLLGKLLGERVARQVTGRVAGRVAPYDELSSNKASPSQPGTDSKR